jgi:hypothetical protein
MNRTLVRLMVGGACGLAVAAGLATWAAEPTTPARPAADQPKKVIESPAKRLLARQTGAAPASATGAFVNPKVQPGKVRWHADFDTACRAATQSGKPVLHFQMMGRLDEKFC